MTKFGFAAVAASGLTAAIVGFAVPAQAADAGENDTGRCSRRRTSSVALTTRSG